MRLIVFSRKNEFSNNVLTYLLEQKILVDEEKYKDYVFYSFTLGEEREINAKAVVVEDFLYLEDKDVSAIEEYTKEECSFLIVSTHKSETQKIDTISIHFPGNFNKNELGGNEKDFSIANIRAFDFLYEHLSKKELPKSLTFLLEATHHGPTLNREVLFYEIGPNENTYNNKDYLEIYTETLLNYLQKENNIKNNYYILIGAQHYIKLEDIERINNKLKEKYSLDKVLFSHVMPKYALNEIIEQNDIELENTLRRLINKSKTEKIILNKEYMKSFGRFKSILENIKKEKNGVIIYII